MLRRYRNRPNFPRIRCNEFAFDQVFGYCAPGTILLTVTPFYDGEMGVEEEGERGELIISYKALGQWSAQRSRLIAFKIHDTSWCMTFLTRLLYEVTYRAFFHLRILRPLLWQFRFTMRKKRD